MSRIKLYSMLGNLPLRDRPIKVLGRQILKANYHVEHLWLDLNGIENVPAYFVRPKKTGKFPVIIYNHAHGSTYNIGKEELFTPRKTMQKRSYADELTKKGYSALCIDHWSFGKRNHNELKFTTLLNKILCRLKIKDLSSESYIFKNMLWHGQYMWGMMVYDSIRAVDYLFTRDDIDIKRIGTLGFSMGSTMAWWLAALDQRIKICIDICGMTDFEELIKNKAIDRHSFYYYVPGLIKEFSTIDINKLIAPRPHLCIAGKQDPLTPLKGLEKINEAMTKAYKKYKENWKMKLYDCGHKETKEMRLEVLKFLDNHL